MSDSEDKAEVTAFDKKLKHRQGELTRLLKILQAESKEEPTEGDSQWPERVDELKEAISELQDELGNLGSTGIATRELLKRRADISKLSERIEGVKEYVEDPVQESRQSWLVSTLRQAEADEASAPGSAGQIMMERDQDHQRLEGLQDTLRRQRVLGDAIVNEFVEQASALDEVMDDMENGQMRGRNLNRSINGVAEHGFCSCDYDCKVTLMFLFVILLMIVIFIVAHNA
eukprot:Clim_evm109s172 gene=Clim_evmTU109s172